MGRSHWGRHTSGWSRVGPPLRPNDEVVAAVAGLLAGHSGPTLLLGVTPELATVGTELLAVERNPEVIANVWPGDTPGRRAVAGEWLDVGRLDRRFLAVVGDGSFNNLRWRASYDALFAQLAEVLEPGGRLVVRTFVTPEPGEDLDAVRAAAFAGSIGNFHACKWHVAMAAVTAAGHPDIEVEHILQAFDQAFPDRDELAAATGWELASIDTIDVYRGSAEVYSFPTETQLLATVPAGFAAAFVAAGTYPLAERCPLVVVDRT